MTIQEIVDKILAYHPDIGDRRTCDVIVGADPNRECTGILISIAPTVPIIRKAIEIGANFIFVHANGWKEMMYMKRNSLFW